MGVRAKYLLVASMDIEPDKEALFNEVYEQEHIPNLLKVPGVTAITRLKNSSADIFIGGRKQPLGAEAEPRYVAMYELDNPEVLVSDEWAAAVEAGRWPSEVRPYTKNRRHVIYEKIYGNCDV